MNYRLPQIAKNGLFTASEGEMTPAVVFMAKLIAFAMVLIAWCTVALGVWIAIMCRVMIIATFKMTVSLLSEGSPESAVSYIENNAQMWPRGLEYIFKVFFDAPKINENHNTSGLLEVFSTIRVFVEMAFAFIFYFSFYLAFREAFGIHIKIFDGLFKSLSIIFGTFIA